MPKKPNNVNDVNVGTPPPPSTPLQTQTAGYGSAGFGAQASAQPVATSIAQAITAEKPVKSGSSRGKMPVALTIVGVVIFIGGVSGLFIYALSGM